MTIFKTKPPLFLVLIFFALLIIGTGALLTYRFYRPIGWEGKVELTINPGESIWQIGKKLAEADLIDAVSFMMYVRWNNLTTKIQAGRYEIPLTLSPAQIVALLQHGTFDVRLTFLEGWRREQFLEYILSQLAVDDAAFTAEFLAETADWEGYLFPDTYSVSINTTARELVAKLRANFDRKYRESVQARAVESGLSKSEIVTIASMLERETSAGGGEEEMRTIAGILIKRWKFGWYLGVDATIQYALGRQWNAEKERWEWWKDNLTSQDLKIDSSYNTYTRLGLPPGPIASPGLGTLLATVNYNQFTPYWYYLHCPDGKIRYAKTLEEHNANRSCLK